MPVSGRARPVRLRAAQRLLVAAAVATAGSAVAVIESASQPSASDESPPRTITVTPADRVELSADDAPLAEDLVTALAARHELVAVASPEPEPPPEPEPVAVPEPQPSAPTAGVWDRVAQCESGGNWAIDTGNGFYGGLQFTLESWVWVGGTGYPHEASRETQIQMAERLLARQGWEAWPVCSRRLGLR